MSDGIEAAYKKNYIASLTPLNTLLSVFVVSPAMLQVMKGLQGDHATLISWNH